MILDPVTTLVALVLGLTQPDPQPAPPQDPAVLAGPRVRTGDARATLIEREFGGKLKRIDTDPVQAVLGLLTLSPEEAAATQTILVERAAIMDKVVTDNLREVVRMAQAFQSQDAAEGLRLAADLFEKAAPLRARGTLEDELAATLTESNGTELRRLTREYRDAAITESAKEPGPGGKARGRIGAVAYERLAGLGNEVRLSFERTIGAGGKELEALLTSLGVSPEQESKLQAIIQDTYIATYGKPTRAQQVSGFLKIYGVLDADQRKEFARYIAEQRGR